jgi:beta-glucosidase-like glycosyl hydrolase
VVLIKRTVSTVVSLGVLLFFLVPSYPLNSDECSAFSSFFSTDIDSLIEEMSLERKIGQTLIFGFWGLSLDEDYRNWLSQGKLGNVKIFLRNVHSRSQLRSLTDTIASLTAGEANSIPPFIATDLEGGVVNHVRSPGILRAPSAGLIGATVYAENNRNVSRLIALTLLDLGINMNFAPCADVLTNPDNTVIGPRSYSSDPHLVTAMVKSFIEEQKKVGILATAKHFPGHGMTDFDSHLTSTAVTTPKRILDQVHIQPYRELIAEHLLDGCMVSHIIYSEFDEQRPATFSVPIVNTLLRKILHFNGIAVTDDLEMKGSCDYAKNIEDAFVLAFNAGNDLMLISHTKSQQEKIINGIAKYFQDGTLSVESLDAKVRRILEIKKEYLTRFYSSQKPLEDSRRALDFALKESMTVMNEGIVKLSSKLQCSTPEYFSHLEEKNLKGIVLAPTHEFANLAHEYVRTWDVLYIGYFPDRRKNRQMIEEYKKQIKSYDIALVGIANERHAQWAQLCVDENVPFCIFSIADPFSAWAYAEQALFIVASFDPYSPGLDALFSSVFRSGNFPGIFPYYF